MSRAEQIDEAEPLSAPNSPSLRPPSGAMTQISTASSTRKLLLAFAAVYIFWGSTYLAIRYGVETIPPLLMSGTRHFFAGVFLYTLARFRGGKKPTLRQWRSAAFVGALLLLCSNGTLAITERILPSSIAALLVATVSLWMVILEWVRPGGVRPTARIAACLAFGFLGVVFLVSPRVPFLQASQDHVNPWAALALIAASLVWAIGSVSSRHVDLPRSALLSAAMYALTGGAMLWIVGFLTREGSQVHLGEISLRSWLAMAYLAIFGSIIGLTAYAYLLKHASPSRVATYAYVNPLVAVFLGWAVAGEPVTARMLIAGAVIIFSVMLVITAPHSPESEDLAQPSIPD